MVYLFDGEEGVDVRAVNMMNEPLKRAEERLTGGRVSTFAGQINQLQ